MPKPSVKSGYIAPLSDQNQVILRKCWRDASGAGPPPTERFVRRAPPYATDRYGPPVRCDREGRSSGISTSPGLTPIYAHLTP